MLRIDKGSRAERCVIARSSVTIPSTVTFKIPPESSYLSLSSDVNYIQTRIVEITNIKQIFQLLFIEHRYLGNPLSY